MHATHDKPHDSFMHFKKLYIGKTIYQHIGELFPPTRRAQQEMLLRLICPTSVFITLDPTNPHTPSVTNITPAEVVPEMSLPYTIIMKLFRYSNMHNEIIIRAHATIG